jgi:hypothetical protein
MTLEIPASSRVVINRDETDVARTTTRQVSLRLLPFVFLLYICNFLDRTNVAIAALQMNRDLHFSATAYGFGAGISESAYIRNNHGQHVTPDTLPSERSRFIVFGMRLCGVLQIGSRCRYRDRRVPRRLV